MFDTINAKFLWKRIPKTVKDEAGSLKELSEITKNLSEKQYAEAFLLIDKLTKALQQDAEKNGTTLKLVEVLTKVLREHHILRDVKKAYQSVELPKIKCLLGFISESD